MDFYQSRKRTSNSTSSNHSSSSKRSHDDGANYNLEYCTSSSSISSLSPFKVAAAAISSTTSPLTCVPTSASQRIDVALVDDLIIPTPSSSSNHSSLLTSNGSSSTVSSSTASYGCSSQNIAGKRKRCHSSADEVDDKDPELCFEPSAKRQQRLPSLYQSDSGSVVSSVYPSPVDELVAEIDSCSPSDECHSIGTGFQRPTNIPDSPNSLHNDADDDDDDDHLDHDHDHDDGTTDDDNDDDEVISGTTSPATTCSIASTKGSSESEPITTTTTTILLPTITHHGERTPSQRQGDTYSTTVTTQVPERNVKSFDDYVSSHYDCMTPASEPEPLRLCPLPALSWANAQDVWQLMCKKDEQAACLRDPQMLEQHPGLQPRMRAILLDWLMEVCEVYKLHRETYYLAVDYLDRYLSTQKKVPKTHLQLIGITCLFVAAKVEEIYPPKIGEFAYVTDGACQEADILQHEILLLQSLEWNISPVTAMGWLGVYMQLNVNNRTPASLNNTTTARNKMRHQKNYSSATSSGTNAGVIDDAFIYPQFSGMQFVQTAQLLDLCTLDMGVACFSYSTLAAAAISHTFNRETALRCSGLDWQSIQECARWMGPFFQVICKESEHLHLTEQNEQVNTKFGLGHICPNIVTDDSHIIQTHTTTMAMFDRAQEIYTASVKKIKQEASPATGLICPTGLLTPPASSRKPIDLDDDEDALEQQHQQQQQRSAGLLIPVMEVSATGSTFVVLDRKAF